MKKTIFALSLLLTAVFSNMANAQTDDDMFNTVFKMEKRAYFSDNMNLKPVEFDKFWTVYGSFENERTAIGKQRVELLRTYVEKYQTLSDVDADAFIKKWLAVDKKEDAMRIKYYSKFKKELGAKVGTHFMQLDDYIQTAIKLEILSELPFIGEFSAK